MRLNINRAKPLVKIFVFYLPNILALPKKYLSGKRLELRNFGWFYRVFIKSPYETVFSGQRWSTEVYGVAEIAFASVNVSGRTRTEILFPCPRRTEASSRSLSAVPANFEACTLSWRLTAVVYVHESDRSHGSPELPAGREADTDRDSTTDRPTQNRPYSYGSVDLGDWNGISLRMDRRTIFPMRIKHWCPSRSDTD